MKNSRSRQPFEIIPLNITERINQWSIIKNSPPTSLFWMALLRIMLGLLFLTTWASNASKGLYTPDGLEEFLRETLNEDSIPLYAEFIENVIIPIRGIFAPFQLVTEFLLGVALLLGFCTRGAALAGAFFIINTYLLSIGTDEWPWSYFTVLGVLGTVYFTKAGRSIGVDVLLLRHFGETKFALW